MPVIGYITKLALAAWEIWIGLQFTWVLVMNTEKTGRSEKILMLIFSTVLGALLVFNRRLAMLSWAMVIFCLLLSFLFMGMVLRKQWKIIFAISWLYYSLIGILNVFFSFIALLVLKENFNDAFYMNEDSVTRHLVYFISCSILMLILKVLKKSVQKKKMDFSKYWYVLYAVGIVLYMILWYYHSLLDDGAHGIDKMTSTTVLSLCLAMLFVGFGGFIVLRYKMIDKEYQALLIQEEMNRKKYDELSKMMEYNARLRHDMKNHLLIIRKYTEENDAGNIQRYLDSINREYLSIDYFNWTGNDIVDTILNQKRKQAKEQKIEFTVDACIIERLPIEESEICSLMGNLLDNAFEAAVKAEKPWVRVMIKKQMDMICFDIRNSYLMKPVLQGEDFVSSKKEKGIHGYGIKSIKRIVEKYEGKITFSVRENQFIVKITFFDVE